jgi:hypothetical protein
MASRYNRVTKEVEETIPSLERLPSPWWCSHCPNNWTPANYRTLWRKNSLRHKTKSVMIATYYCDQHAEEYARKHDQAWPVPVVEEAAHT